MRCQPFNICVARPEIGEIPLPKCIIEHVRDVSLIETIYCVCMYVCMYVCVCVCVCVWGGWVGGWVGVGVCIGVWLSRQTLVRF